MRNAAAKFDDDFVFEQSARKVRPRRPGGAGSRKRAKPKRDGSRYLRYAAVGLSVTLTIGIMINALALQQSQHPAPLFATPIAHGEDGSPAIAPRQTLTPTPAPKPAPTPAPRAALPASTKPNEQTGGISALLVTPSHPVPPQKLATPVQRPRHVAEATPAKSKSDDAIGKLLQTSTMASSETPRNHVKEPPKADPTTVLATQHALMKLGFVIKPNGAFGPATHAAIEAFERDQHMPVKGEMSRKLLKQLSAESGVAID